MPDFPTQNYVSAAVEKNANILDIVCQYGKWGGNSIGSSFEKVRLNQINGDLLKAGVSPERVVDNVQSVLSKKALMVLGCGARHEAPDGSLCFGFESFHNNIGCLHVGDSQMEMSISVLRAWGLLPKTASILHNASISRSKKVAIFDSNYPQLHPRGRTSLDQAAAILWKEYGRDPRTVPWWQERINQLVQFREGIRDALLKVHPDPKIQEHLSYIRDAFSLCMKRPQRISTHEFWKGMNEAGIPVSEDTQFKYRMQDD